MTILTEGQSISIEPTDESHIIGIAMGWDAIKDAAPSCDLDLSAFMLTMQGHIPTHDYFVFYNNPIPPDRSMKHQGDDRLGKENGDDEVILVNLKQVSPNVVQIMFTASVNADRHGVGDNISFLSQVANVFVRVFEYGTGKEIARYPIDKQFEQENGMVVGRLSRIKSAWSFKAGGITVKGGMWELVEKFG